MRHPNLCAEHDYSRAHVSALTRSSRAAPLHEIVRHEIVRHEIVRHEIVRHETVRHEIVS